MEPTLRVRKRRLLRDFFIFFLSVVIAVYLQGSEASSLLLGLFSGFYFVPIAILMGFLFSLTFTAAISTSVFILLAETSHNPYFIALLGGVGSVCANAVIDKLFGQEIIEDIKLLEGNYAKKIAHKIMHSKLFVGLIPYLAALTLLSPLPDEIGILMLNGVHVKYTKIFLISFGLHAIGILAIVIGARTYS